MITNIINKLEVYDIQKIKGDKPRVRNVIGRNFFYEWALHVLTNLIKTGVSSLLDPIVQLFRSSPLKSCQDLKVKLHM